MTYSVGIAYVVSLFLLTFVVASVYSASQEAFLPLRGVVRQTVRRSVKLLGVLGALAVAVYVLCKI